MSDRVLHPIVELTRARLKELVREPEVIFWVFAFPVLMTLALGVAFRDQRDATIPVGVTGGADTERVVEALRAPGLGLSPRRLSATDAGEALRNGVVAIVVVPSSPPVYRYDPSRPESRLARLSVDTALQRADGRADLWTADVEQVAAPGSRYIDWLVPGLLGMNVMGTGLWGIGFAVVMARHGKLLKRMMATPLRRWHYLLAQVLSRLVFLVGEVALILGFARLMFGVPMVGSWVALSALVLEGAVAFCGVGLLVASRARTVETVSGLINVVMVPMWICSGVFFSSDRFPEGVQPVIDLLPLTALNDGLRGVMLEGASLLALGPQVLVLAAWGAGSFLIALRIFRWR